MSLHHYALRRQALLNMLDGGADAAAADPNPLIIDLNADQTEFEALCREAWMVTSGSGSVTICSISPGKSK